MPAPLAQVDDIGRLLGVLGQLVDLGHTVLVIEHNLDVIKTADWVIDLGPEGGAAGGQIVATGTPEEVAQCDASHTGRWLQAVLGDRRCNSETNLGSTSHSRHNPNQSQTKQRQRCRLGDQC